MTLANTLEPIYEEYKITHSCFKVVIRAIQENNTDMLENTDIIYTSNKTIQDCQSQMNNLAVVALWAFFERRLIEFVQARSSIAFIRQAGPLPFSDLLGDNIEKYIERKGELLDLFKGNIDRNLLEEANKIKKFRDWIVHRNPSKKPRETDATNPELAYRSLSAILTHLDGM